MGRSQRIFLMALFYKIMNIRFLRLCQAGVMFLIQVAKSSIFLVCFGLKRL